MKDQIDAIFSWIGHKMAVGGGLSSLVSAALSERGIALAGLLIGAIGLTIQAHYQRKRDRREQAEHEARMSLMR